MFICPRTFSRHVIVSIELPIISVIFVFWSIYGRKISTKLLIRSLEISNATAPGRVEPTAGWSRTLERRYAYNATAKYFKIVKCNPFGASTRYQEIANFASHQYTTTSSNTLIVCIYNTLSVFTLNRTDTTHDIS